MTRYFALVAVVLAVGVYVLLGPIDVASSTDGRRQLSCGGSPVAVLAHGASGRAAAEGDAANCHDSAVGSTILGGGVLAAGLMMAVATVALRQR